MTGTYELSTCFSGELSTLDASLCQEAVAPYLVGTELFALTTTNVFYGRRLAHTNVHIKLRDVTLAQAREATAALSTLTGKRWNAPTQDYDEVEAALEGKSTYGMFTAEGATRVAGIVALLDAALRTGTLSPTKLDEALEGHRKALADEGHGEVYDTDVREQIWAVLDRTLEELGVQLERW